MHCTLSHPQVCPRSLFSLATMSNTSKKSVDILPGGERVVTCSYDKTVRMWNVGNGEQEGTPMEHDGWVSGLAVTKDGKRILNGGEDKKIRVWDVETHEFMEEWGAHTGNIWCIAMALDDLLTASGDNNGKIVIREVKEGGRTKHSIEAGSIVRSLCFSPNGKKLAAAVDRSEDDHITHVIRVYDVESGELILGSIKGHERFVRCVLWSLDGSWLFTSSGDSTIRCWNSETGEPIGQPWTGHTDAVTSLSLSPDGTKVASASFDKTVRFWDVHSGEPVEQPLQHERRLWAVTFSPSGKFVATGGYDNKVSIWRVPWWDDSQKQVITAFTYLPTTFLTVLVATGT
ncbi:WD40 repeat-like protein [Gyrodon lividus]|nr:WD40 repeat-like protein [Gyrodon lividus]